jgi:hypothetical protein
MDDKLDNLDKPRRKKKSNPDLVWNVLTILMLLGTCLVAGVSYNLYVDPYSELNIFPPNTPLPTPIPPTWTPIAMPAIWTPTVTIQPSPSNTKRPTITLEPSITPFSLATPTLDVTPTVTGKPTGVPYAATISYHDSATFNPSSDCTKLIIAGRVLNAKNQPVQSLIVKMGGGLPGKSFVPPAISLTGVVRSYGESGFEFDTGVAPVDSSKTLWVQLFTQDEKSLSDKVFITTYKDCNKNLVLVTFQEK